MSTRTQIFERCLKISICACLRQFRAFVGSEVQLTDAIRMLIESGGRVLGVTLEDYELRLDVGAPETCWEAFKASYEHFGWMGDEWRACVSH
jgi:UTP-glucose-1-phosphate uridylyltransferase